MLNSSIWPIDKTLSNAPTSGHSGPMSNGNEGVLHITQSSITGALPLYYLVSYLGHSLREFLTLCRDPVGIFCLFRCTFYILYWILLFVFYPNTFVINQYVFLFVTISFLIFAPNVSHSLEQSTSFAALHCGLSSRINSIAISVSIKFFRWGYVFFKLLESHWPSG